MEAIKQTIENGSIIILALIIGIIIVTVGAFLSIDNNIVTDEAFKVTSDTSKYTCIISETDNNLSLDCLRMK